MLAREKQQESSHGTTQKQISHEATEAYHQYERMKPSYETGESSDSEKKSSVDEGRTDTHTPKPYTTEKVVPVTSETHTHKPYETKVILTSVTTGTSKPSAKQGVTSVTNGMHTSKPYVTETVTSTISGKEPVTSKEKPGTVEASGEEQIEGSGETIIASSPLPVITSSKSGVQLEGSGEITKELEGSGEKENEAEKTTSAGTKTSELTRGRTIGSEQIEGSGETEEALLHVTSPSVIEGSGEFNLLTTAFIEPSFKTTEAFQSSTAEEAESTGKRNFEPTLSTISKEFSLESSTLLPVLENTVEAEITTTGVTGIESQTTPASTRTDSGLSNVSENVEGSGESATSEPILGSTKTSVLFGITEATSITEADKTIPPLSQNTVELSSGQEQQDVSVPTPSSNVSVTEGSGETTQMLTSAPSSIISKETSGFFSATAHPEMVEGSGELSPTQTSEIEGSGEAVTSATTSKENEIERTEAPVLTTEKEEAEVSTAKTLTDENTSGTENTLTTVSSDKGERITEKPDQGRVKTTNLAAHHLLGIILC